MDLRLFLLSCDEIRHSNAWKVDAFEIDDIINTVQDKNLEKQWYFYKNPLILRQMKATLNLATILASIQGQENIKHKTFVQQKTL